MFKTVCLSLVCVFVLLGSTCDDSRIAPYDGPFNLTGDYIGEIEVFLPDSDPIKQDIAWQFSNTGYSMRYIDIHQTGRQFCDNIGSYVFDKVGLELTKIFENEPHILCPVEYNPTGLFRVFKPIPSSPTIILEQVLPEKTTRIRIYPSN